MIKKQITTLIFLVIAILSYSQVRNYDDTALLFSQENINGTARYTAMSGAFGAIGGDLSAANINPAGLTFFNSSEASFTLAHNKIDFNTSFYNAQNNFNNKSLKFAQAGGVLVFETNSKNWNKFAIGINITSVNDFNSKYRVVGNSNHSNESYFIDPDPNFELYNNVTSQIMENSTLGNNYKTTFSLASKFNKYLSFGFSLVANSINYTQYINIQENSTDINNEIFQGELEQRLYLNAEGFGVNLGVIAKPTKNLRLGLSFQTPTYYNINEEFKEDINIDLSNSGTISSFDDSLFDYNLKTPSKTTASFAYIFGKSGLISADYTFKDYSAIKLKPNNDFNDLNQNLNQNLKATGQWRIGGEYRLKQISLRAGYFTENSSYKNTSFSNLKEGYSLGLGFKIFRKTKLDLSYNKTTTNDHYYYLNTPNPIKIDQTKSKVLATLTIDL